MSDFETSTHRANWIFSPQQLAEKRKFVNQRAKKLLEEYGTSRMQVDIEGSCSIPDSQAHKSNCNAMEVDTNGFFPKLESQVHDRHSRPKSLGVEDEEFMRVYYEFKLREVCSAFYFPHKIQAAALIYFKRFYLQWSVMEHDPKHIMLTCIYAACKIEENHVSAEELGKGISQDHQMILNYEMIVLQSLDFELIVFAPYRSVEGFFTDMIESSYGNKSSKELMELKEAAMVEVDKIMLTDGPLLFPPARMALAAMKNAYGVSNEHVFDGYLNGILERHGKAHTYWEFSESFNAIYELVKEYKFPTEKDVKHINRKLKSCWGQNSHDESKRREKKPKHK